MNDVFFLNAQEGFAVGPGQFYRTHNGGETITSVNEDAQSALIANIFPNPSNGNVTLDYHINTNEDALLDITDMTGKRITSYRLSAAANTLQINNDGLNNGIYIYRIIVNQEVVKREKLMIIK